MTITLFTFLRNNVGNDWKCTRGGVIIAQNK